jgi:hypothetical protein
MPDSNNTPKQPKVIKLGARQPAKMVKINEARLPTKMTPANTD